MKGCTTQKHTVADTLTLDDLKEAFDSIEKYQQSTFLLDSYLRRLPCFGSYRARSPMCSICFMLKECEHINEVWIIMAITEVALLPKYLTHDSDLVRQIAESQYRKIMKGSSKWNLEV